MFYSFARRYDPELSSTTLGLTYAGTAIGAQRTAIEESNPIDAGSVGVMNRSHRG